MARSLLVVLVFLGLTVPAQATQSPRREPSLPLVFRALSASPRQALLSATPKTAREPFIVTDDTEVHLNGRRCSFREVPRDATILSVELAIDGRTIRKIRFRSSK